MVSALRLVPQGYGKFQEHQISCSRVCAFLPQCPWLLLLPFFRLACIQYFWLYFDFIFALCQIFTMYSSSKIYISFQQILLGKLNIHVQLNGTGPFLTPHTENHSKWTENSKLKNTESVIFLEGIMGRRIHDIGKSTNRITSDDEAST